MIDTTVSGVTRIFGPMGKPPCIEKQMMGKMGKIFIDGATNY